MSHEESLIANIVIPEQIAQDFETTLLDGVTLERVPGEQQSHRFGLAEAVVIVGVAKSILELIKLAIEIRDRLRTSAPTQVARLSAPGGVSWVDVTASMDDDGVEKAVRRQFS